MSPALKWQIGPVPGKIDLSAVFGMGLPTGSVAIAGRGVQPYVQLPWSWELHDGWRVSGMFTEFFRPSTPFIEQRDRFGLHRLAARPRFNLARWTYSSFSDHNLARLKAWSQRRRAPHDRVRS